MEKNTIIFLIITIFIIIPASIDAQKQDKIDKLINKRKYDEAEKYCLKQNGEYQKKCYTTLANAILTYRNDYNKAETYYIKAGKSNEVNLRFALNVINLAQSANDDSEIQRFYSKADSLFSLANYIDFVFETFKYPTKNLYLEKGSASLTESVETPHYTTYYLYGGSNSVWFSYESKNEKINRYVPYRVMLASSNGATVNISLYLLRDGKWSVLGENVYKISKSKSFKSYIGFFILDESIKCLPNDKLFFQIRGGGYNTDYSISHANFDSWVKLVEFSDTLNENILDERKKAITWFVSNNRWSHPNDLLLSFIAQLDYCVLNDINATWYIGSNFPKDELSYQIKWTNNNLTIEKLIKENADSLGVTENSFIFRKE